MESDLDTAFRHHDRHFEAARQLDQGPHFGNRVPVKDRARLTDPGAETGVTFLV